MKKYVVDWLGIHDGRYFLFSGLDKRVFSTKEEDASQEPYNKWMITSDQKALSSSSTITIETIYGKP